MVSHSILVRGADLRGTPSNQPVLLQMNLDDFPARFFRDLAAPDQPPLSSTRTVTGTPDQPAVLFQPVQRLLPVALLRLACDSVGEPRLDPARIDSCGVVIRRVPRRNGKDLPHARPWAWVRLPAGNVKWMELGLVQEDEDPDPVRRPQLQSGQPELDRKLAEQWLAAAFTESVSQAFIAPPGVCEALQKTLVFASIPTASSEVADEPPVPPVFDDQSLLDNLPALLRAGSHPAPLAGQFVEYHYMSPDYLQKTGNTAFLPFSTALRMLFNVFGAFDKTPEAQNVVRVLNRHYVTFGWGRNASQTAMGTFYEQAAKKLIDLDRPVESVPRLRMPDAWDSFTDADQKDLLNVLKRALQARSARLIAPQGRYQDSTRLYKLRFFLRVKGDSPDCPPQLVWSDYSAPFRIAAWYESGDRTHPPVPLPDPTKAFLHASKPNAAFAVPAGLMNAIEGASLKKLSEGSNGGGSGITLDWICGFNIPLITICAFFVLNIFLQLLNIVFFWLPFVKICIPSPTED